jgi:hypothetical protein
MRNYIEHHTPHTAPRCWPNITRTNIDEEGKEVTVRSICCRKTYDQVNYVVEADQV